MDRLDRLRLFLLVADHGSFTEAARRQRVSPTAVTRAINALEDSLGAQLLRRTTRSVRLTEAGAAYLDRCRRALADLDDAARQVAGEDSAPQGTLIISAPVVFGRLHVLPIVADLLMAHPRLSVRLILTDRMVRLAEEGVDVAVRLSDLPDSSLRAVRIGQVRRVLVASPDYLGARGAPETPAGLCDHDLIAFETLSVNNEWRFGGGSHATVRFEPRLLTNSVDAAIEAAVLGCGIARTLDYQVREHLRAGRLVELLRDTASAAVPVSVVYGANRHASPNVRAFVAAAQNRGGVKQEVQN